MLHRTDERLALHQTDARLVLHRTDERLALHRTDERLALHRTDERLALRLRPRSASLSGERPLLELEAVLASCRRPGRLQGSSCIGPTNAPGSIGSTDASPFVGPSD